MNRLPHQTKPHVPIRDLIHGVHESRPRDYHGHPFQGHQPISAYKPEPTSVRTGYGERDAEAGVRRALERYFSRNGANGLSTQNPAQAGYGGDGVSAERIDNVGDDLATAVQQPPQERKGKGYHRIGASLLAAAYLMTAAGCLAVKRIELHGPNQRQGMESVSVVDIVGRDPKQFGPFTIPYYIINLAQLVVDSHDFTKFVHDSYRIRCQGGGLVKALEIAQVPNHYAQRLLSAGCYDNSERGVHDALKKMTPEQRGQVAQELERILRQEMKNELIRVTVISEEEKNKFLKELDEIKGVSTTGIAPELRDGLALVISAGIWYGIGSAIDAAVSSGGHGHSAPAATTPAPPGPPGPL